MVTALPLVLPPTVLGFSWSTERTGAEVMNGHRIELSFSRGGFRLCVDMELSARGVTAILGPSGSGRSTLLRLVAGLEEAERGSMQIRGRSWLDTGRGLALTAQKRRVGMVFQDYALFSNMTVSGNVGYGPPRKGRRSVVGEWIERPQLTGIGASCNGTTLSSGYPVRDTVIRIVSSEGTVLADGTKGEIQVGGPASPDASGMRQARSL